MTKLRNMTGKQVRDWMLFLGGLVGTAYETIVAEVDRPSLLAVFAGMMGLPLFLRRDERDDDQRPPDGTDEPEPPPPARGG